MKTTTLDYDWIHGWSGPLPAAERETLVLAFGAPEVGADDRPFLDLRTAYPEAIFAGCSTAGEIRGAEVQDGTLTVAIASFDRTRLAVATAPIRDWESSHGTGQTLGRALARPDLRAILVLADGLKTNGAALVASLQATVGAGVVITGGLAADAGRFERTWVLADRDRGAGLAVAVGFYGDAIRVGHGSRGGWDVFGPERRITRARGDRLLELDGAPALDLYKRYLGERAAELPASALLFPLALRQQRSDGDAVVRAVLGIDDAQRSLRVAGEVPEGAHVQLMRANSERLIEAAHEAGKDAQGTAAGEGLAIAISCVGRRVVLGQRAEEETEAVASALSPRTALAGFYSYGEIAPCREGGPAVFHNQTMTLTRFEET